MEIAPDTSKIKEYESLLLLPFEEVAVLLKNQHDEVIQGFINYLFDLLESQLNLTTSLTESKYKIDIRLALTWCTWLLCGGHEPTTFLTDIKDKTQPRVCTKVWNDGYYFYRCRDCEMSPSSSVCFECFQSGNHKGHDFIFERSVYGGCCDCGNPHAWKSTGFCPTHTGSFSEDPSVIIPSDLKRVARIVLRSLIRRLYKYLPHTVEKVKIVPGYYPIIAGIVNWVRYIGSFGEAMLHLIRLEFLYGQSPLPVEVYLNSTLSLQTDVLDEVLFLFLDLLQDPNFKEKFITYYIKIYPALIDHMMDTRGEVNVVYKISPQLFSIPAITLPLAKLEGGIFDMMLVHLYRLFESMSDVDERTGLKMIDCDHKFISPHNYYAFTNDLNTLLGSTDLAVVLVSERMDLMSILLKILALLQGVDPATRKTDAYVEYESETWKSAFSLEVELNRSVSNVVEGFKAMLQDKENSLAKIQKLFHILEEPLLAWINAQKITTAERKGYEMAVYDVSTQPVSVHLPLHRSLSRFIYAAAKALPEVSLQSLLSLNSLSKEFVTLLVEHPLHIQVFLAQVRADMWIRNGFSVINQVFLYKGSYFMESYNADIAILQAGIVLLGPELFFEIVLDRFGLGNWFVLNEQIPEAKELIVVEDFFRFLINVISERSRIGKSLKSVLRREIIHQLAIEDLTHSKLVAELNHRLVEHREFDTVLKEVSVYKAPTTTGSPGIFSLKSECWKEFDPFFPRYEAQSSQKAMERYTTHKPKVHPPIQLEKTFASFSTVVNLLHTPHLHYTYYIILSSVLQSPNHVTAYESIFRTTLHLILMTLDNREDYEAYHRVTENTHEYTSSDLMLNMRHNINDTNLLLLLIQMHQRSQFQEHMDYIVPILRKVAVEDSHNRSIIVEHIPDFDKSDSSSKDATDSEAKRKARERQAAILAQFATQQKAFLKSVDDEEEEKEEEKTELQQEEESKEDDYETISSGALCALCRSEAPASEGRVLGVIALVQSSRILSIAKGQDVGSVVVKKYEKSAKRTEPKKPQFKLSSSNSFPDMDMDEEEKEEEEEVEEEVDSMKIEVGVDHALTRNLDEIPSPHTQYCGHCMHDDCFAQFYTSIRNKHAQYQLQNRSLPTNVEKGEFFCPVCRRLSNALIPIVPKEYVDVVKDVVVKDISQWTVTPYPNYVKVPPIAVLQVFTDLAKRFNDIMKPAEFSANDFLSLYFDVIISNLSSIEIVTRHPSFIASLSQTFVCIQLITRCTKAIGNFHENSLKQGLFKSLVNIFEGSVEPVFSNKAVALLSLELFAFLVRWLFLAPGGLNPANIQLILRPLWAAHVLQCFLAIYTTNNPLIPEEGKSQHRSLFVDCYHKVINKFSKRVEDANVSDDALYSCVKSMSISFLRRVAMLLNVLLPDVYHFQDLSCKDYDVLIKNLSLPSLDSLFSVSDINNYVDVWCSQLSTCLNKQSLSPSAIPRIGVAKPTQFIELPNTFQELLLKFMGVKCRECDTVPKQGGVCLLCGGLCCIASQCCLKNDRGEASRHTETCPGGVFLILKSTYVLILRDEKRAVWGSLYLDEHGEEDPNMRRGKTLYLNQPRYEELLKMWLNQSFDHDSKVIAATVLDGHFM